MGHAALLDTRMPSMLHRIARINLHQSDGVLRVTIERKQLQDIIQQFRQRMPIAAD